MTDVTQGADAPDDNALFNDATSATTLDKFENPELPKAEPPAPKADAPKEGDPPKPADPPRDDAQIPAQRLREESEARRRVERERDELRARVDALSRPPPPAPQDAPQKVDLFEDPERFVDQRLKPFLEQIRADFQSQREAMSLDWARRSHGVETVDAAYQAMKEGMTRGEPNAWETYKRAMGSHDPYGVIVGWHRDGEVLRTTGGDLNAYRARVLEEALKDPEYQKKVFEAAKGQAVATGNTVARPVKSSVASSPSLGNFGAGGGDDTVVEPSDEQLFRAAVTAKRR
jgi:hypothetical protein